MFAEIKNFLDRPEIFTPSETSFWTDEHISKQLLAAHLNPNYEGASRRLSMIEDSVEWITQEIPPQYYPKLIDVDFGRINIRACYPYTPHGYRNGEIQCDNAWTTKTFIEG